MPHPLADDQELLDLLTSSSNIAVVGCSDRPDRTSFRIARYLQSVGYRVVPVNPNHNQVLGEVCYPSLEAIPESIPVDIVNIFRRPAFTAIMVQDAVVYAKKTGSKPAIWTQLGVSTDTAKIIADEADLPYIHNRCIMVEHSRLIG